MALWSETPISGAILDLKGRDIVSFAIGRHTNQLVFETFDLAIQKYPDAHPLFHSDRGFQYTSKQFKDMLEKQGMRQSMSRVGRCIDNGPMEGFWGILKCEMYYLNHFETYEELVSLLQLPTASASPKLSCTNELPQLVGCCIKENQDLISEILEKTFCFLSVYLTGSGSISRQPFSDFLSF